ncbi:MAG: tetratricopeptide repeat protein, partial [Gemmatimonadaceae bacterium]
MSAGLAKLATGARAADLLKDARAQDRAGRLIAAVARYSAAIALAEDHRDPAMAAEGLRGLAEAHYKRGNAPAAIDFCRRSHDIARDIGDERLVAEALNTMGCLHIATGQLNNARLDFLEALRLGGLAGPIRARAQQNLGILANIQGALDEALAWYGRSLEEYRA